MAYKIRDLINDAYRVSGVTGIGMSMTADQLDDGVSLLNIILDHIYSLNAVQTTITQRVTLNGQGNYTIGVTPEDPLATPPDIVVPILPLNIERIILDANTNVREIVQPIDPITYFSRDMDTLNTSSPTLFYYEKTQPFGTIRFLEGTPSGQADIVYKSALVDVTSNTDYSSFPRELKPYLIHELAYKLASINQFETDSIKMQANNYWNAYFSSTYTGQGYMSDGSIGVGGNSRFNIYSDNW